jgi:hypothetical protein
MVIRGNRKWFQPFNGEDKMPVNKNNIKAGSRDGRI